VWPHINTVPFVCAMYTVQSETLNINFNILKQFNCALVGLIKELTHFSVPPKCKTATHPTPVRRLVYGRPHVSAQQHHRLVHHSPRHNTACRNLTRNSTVYFAGGFHGNTCSQHV
jgi:hypothetical protein